MSKTLKEAKEEMRNLVNLKMDDYRKSNCKEMLRYIAWGVLQAASWIDAISEEEYEKLLEELEGQRETCES